MLGFFESIIDWISLLGNYLIHWITNLVSGLFYIVSAADYVTKAMAFLPPVLLIPAGAVLAIAVFHLFTLSS